MFWLHLKTLQPWLDRDKENINMAIMILPGIFLSESDWLCLSSSESWWTESETCKFKGAYTSNTKTIQQTACSQTLFTSTYYIKRCLFTVIMGVIVLLVYCTACMYTGFDLHLFSRPLSSWRKFQNENMTHVTVNIHFILVKCKQVSFVTYSKYTQVGV